MRLNKLDKCPSYIRLKCIKYSRITCVSCVFCDEKETEKYRVCEHCPSVIRKLFEEEFEFINAIDVANNL